EIKSRVVRKTRTFIGRRRIWQIIHVVMKALPTDAAAMKMRTAMAAAVVGEAVKSAGSGIATATKRVRGLVMKTPIAAGREMIGGTGVITGAKPIARAHAAITNAAMVNTGADTASMGAKAHAVIMNAATAVMVRAVMDRGATDNPFTAGRGS